MKGKRLSGRTGLRLKGIIKMDVEEVECKGVGWINLAQVVFSTFVNKVTKIVVL